MTRSQTVREGAEHEADAGRARGSKKRANDLDGGQWTRNSISIWSDIRKTKQEGALRHPAMFPEALATRLIQCLTTSQELNILDPFMGSGATMGAAFRMGRKGIGIEIYQENIEKAGFRFKQGTLELGERAVGSEPLLIRGDARHVTELVREPVDLCITSPPYWNILERNRTADYKEIRNYGDSEHDLGKIEDYELFLAELDKVWSGVHEVLKPGGYFCVVVMDLRKENRFFPFHMDLTFHVQRIGRPAFELDDIIIWNRQGEYNNLRSLGFPYKFRVNKVHEYVLIFQKPAGAPGGN